MIPIDIKTDILDRLQQAEAEHGVRVLLAVESGSRAWGFASPDSDYDVRFIYVHPLPWYLQVSLQRDVIEYPIVDEIDINGWELRKALSLLKQGNVTLIEWLDSPVVYRAESDFLHTMRNAIRLTHRPERSFHHYVHMARKNNQHQLRGETVRLKKYLYTLRPLLAALWIEQGRGIAPMQFQDLVDAIITDSELRAAIEHLLKIKRSAGESEHGKPLPVLNSFINFELSRLQRSAPPDPAPIDYSVLDGLLMDTVLQYENTRAECR